MKSWFQVCVFMLSLACASPKGTEQKASAPKSADPTSVPGPSLDALLATFRNTQNPSAARTEALQQMVPLDDPRGSDVLAELAEDPKLDRTYRRQATMALGQRGGPKAAATLSRMLETTDVALREAAARALGQLRGVEARAALEPRLDIEDAPDVREAIQQALTKLEP